MLCICSISIPSHKFYRVCNSMESYFHERDINFFLRSVTLFWVQRVSGREVWCPALATSYITLSTTTSVQSNAYQLQEELVAQGLEICYRHNHLKYVALTTFLDHSCVCTVILHLLHKQLKEWERNVWSNKIVFALFFWGGGVFSGLIWCR